MPLLVSLDFVPKLARLPPLHRLSSVSFRRCCFPADDFRASARQQQSATSTTFLSVGRALCGSARELADRNFDEVAASRVLMKPGLMR